MLAVYSITLAWGGVSNMFMGAGWSAFAIVQLAFAARVFYNFRRFGHVEA